MQRVEQTYFPPTFSLIKYLNVAQLPNHPIPKLSELAPVELAPNENFKKPLNSLLLKIKTSFGSILEFSIV